MKVESRVIEEIPEPKAIMVTEFRVAHYDCPFCGEHVVIRKIIGTLRNEKGTSIHETVMSCLVTWRQQGLNPYGEIVRLVC